MNPKPTSETETLRSDIEMTRRRMDDTMEALGERIKGSHLVDEVIGFFRPSEASDKTSEAALKVKEKLSDAAGKLSDSAGSAANAVVDTVKKNPLPILLITAGAAWLAYNAIRKRSTDPEEDMKESDRYDPDTHYDRPLEYPGGVMGQSGTDKMSSAKEQIKDKISDFADKMPATYQSVKDRASDVGSRVRDRAGEISGRVQEQTKEIYGKTRDKVAETADQHPVPVGLGCLALGVLIGLALPTPDPVKRLVGPTVDRLRTRTREAGRDVLQKGKRVVQAATTAAKQEAQSQGLTLEHLRESASAVGERAQSAAAGAAQTEGLMSGNRGSEAIPRSGAEPSDPSSARPAM